MVKDNPIIPSEPLSLQPDLLAAAVVAEQNNNNEREQEEESMSPRSSTKNNSKSRHRLDRRQFGRSGSRSFSNTTSISSNGREVSHYRQQQQQQYNSNRSRSGGYHRPNNSRSPVMMGSRYRGEKAADGVDNSPPPHHSRGSSGREDRRDNRSSIDTGANSVDTGRYGQHYSGGGEHERIAYDQGATKSNDSETHFPYKSGNSDTREQAQPSRVLGVFGMSKFTMERDLYDLFGKYGRVEKVQIIRDPYEKRSRGFAFVNMAELADAEKAREATTGMIINDRKVRVDYSITNRAHSPTPGKYKGQETASLPHSRQQPNNTRHYNGNNNSRSYNRMHRRPHCHYHQHYNNRHGYRGYEGDSKYGYNQARRHRHPNSRDRRRYRRESPGASARAYSPTASDGLKRRSARASRSPVSSSYRGRSKSRYNGNGPGARRDNYSSRYGRGDEYQNNNGGGRHSHARSRSPQSSTAHNFHRPSRIWIQ